ncbi:MAG: phosphogluconate dehydrogenase (NAD(+)-dependent, decarboxylating) [Anaerolineae bacterium]
MSLQAVNTGYGLIGLGLMGQNAVRNLLAQGQRVVVYNRTHEKVDLMVREGAVGAQSIAELVSLLSRPRVVWLMVAAGQPVDDTLFASGGLAEHLSPGDVVIDGGNSFYRDSMRRAAQLKELQIHYLDCGSSGGLEGARNGMCLMVGGEPEAFALAEPLFHMLAVEDGYAHVGPSGAGHFVKMVHNGIEYGLLEAIGEGFELLAQGPFDVDLRQVADLWRHGSVVRGWLMDLAARALEKDPRLEAISGIVGGGATGSWAIEEGWKAGAPMTAIALAYALRLRSRQTDSFAGKMVAALRYEFGGHETVPSGRGGDEACGL